MVDGDVLTLALMVHREPAQGFVLQGLPLPADIGTAIQLAAGNPELLSRAAERLGVEGGRLLEAVRFYLQQVLFEADGDAYRTLGLTPDAPFVRIREHYRWLQRWLHPDRRGEEWETLYVTRVNQAWSRLRTEAMRSAYDEERARAPVDTGNAIAIQKGGWKAKPVDVGPANRVTRLMVGASVGICVLLLVLVLRREDATPYWPDGVGVGSPATSTKGRNHATNPLQTSPDRHSPASGASAPSVRAVVAAGHMESPVGLSTPSATPQQIRHARAQDVGAVPAPVSDAGEGERAPAGLPDLARQAMRERGDSSVSVGAGAAGDGASPATGHGAAVDMIAGPLPELTITDDTTAGSGAAGTGAAHVVTPHGQAAHKTRIEPRPQLSEPLASAQSGNEKGIPEAPGGGATVVARTDHSAPPLDVAGSDALPPVRPDSHAVRPVTPPMDSTDRAFAVSPPYGDATDNSEVVSSSVPPDRTIVSAVLAPDGVVAGPAVDDASASTESPVGDHASVAAEAPSSMSAESRSTQSADVMSDASPVSGAISIDDVELVRRVDLAREQVREIVQYFSRSGMAAASWRDHGSLDTLEKERRALQRRGGVAAGSFTLDTPRWTIADEAAAVAVAYRVDDEVGTLSVAMVWRDGAWRVTRVELQPET